MLSHSHPLAFTGVVEGAASESRHFWGLSPACPLQQGGPGELQASHEGLWCSLLSESTPFSLHDLRQTGRDFSFQLALPLPWTLCSLYLNWLPPRH